MKRLTIFAVMLAVMGTTVWGGPAAKKAPRIVNIVNFIRAVEPRDAYFTHERLLETVAKQMAVMREEKLRGTFLLQYDALINPDYQQLLRDSLPAGSEIGGWWEITQPHVEAAGFRWKGRFPWDWHADVGFATGYTPEERERLVDFYMERFREVFGHYPRSVGSWFIDAHTLGYMYDRYGIVASCNCKDQYGTDGYTLWGGYWNQAYYPSRVNAYMPAQTEEGQIPVPIFRMLGSDPIYQYDTGLGGRVQGVITLEPVYKEGGRNPQWTEWFMRTMFTAPCLSFNYVQAGQENSFIWEQQGEGFAMQMPMLRQWLERGVIRVETLEESGRWFRSRFPVTPATAVTALTDPLEQGRQALWYNSRFYRTSLSWEQGELRFRDIHFFDETVVSRYLTKPCASNQCLYTTLPLVDGFLWSNREMMAGLRPVLLNEDGTSQPLRLGNPVVKEQKGNTLRVVSTDGKHRMEILLQEDNIKVTMKGAKRWALELTAAPDAKLPFRLCDGRGLLAQTDDATYRIECRCGQFKMPSTSSPQNKEVFRLIPEDNAVIINGRAQAVRSLTHPGKEGGKRINLQENLQEK